MNAPKSDPLLSLRGFSSSAELEMMVGMETLLSLLSFSVPVTVSTGFRFRNSAVVGVLRLPSVSVLVIVDSRLPAVSVLVLNLLIISLVALACCRGDAPDPLLRRTMTAALISPVSLSSPSSYERVCMSSVMGPAPIPLAANMAAKARSFSNLISGGVGVLRSSSSSSTIKPG